MPDKRRSHKKINTFSPEIIEQINKYILDGWTYQRIADWCNGKGLEIDRKAVNRYGADFLKRMEELKQIRDQAKYFIEEIGDKPATQLAEVASNIALQMIQEALIEAKKGELNQDKLTDVLNALARLESSSAKREAVKLQYVKKWDAVYEKIQKEIDKRLSGRPEVLKEVLSILNEIKEEDNGK